MSSLNKVMLIGHLGRDPEIRTTNSGARLANLNLATSEQWRDKASGERRERTEWHRVVAFDEQAVNFAEAYLKKGATVYVEGQLQTRKWQDQSGETRYATEVVIQRFGGTLRGIGKAQRDDGGGEAQGRAHSSAAAPDFDDEIPF